MLHSFGQRGQPACMASSTYPEGTGRRLKGGNMGIDEKDRTRVTSSVMDMTISTLSDQLGLAFKGTWSGRESLPFAVKHRFENAPTDVQMFSCVTSTLSMREKGAANHRLCIALSRILEANNFHPRTQLFSYLALKRCSRRRSNGNSTTHGSCGGRMLFRPCISLFAAP